ncbi:MAG: PQQ-binding-like beta-propeller repeat protein [Ignavibacteriae bacterium]|nr:PQQ-binding-like beta-propeller repeat protein [Ignavibacteriota bacterium]
MTLEPVEKGGTHFYGTRSGLLIALNALNGDVKWMYKTGVALLNTVAPIDSRRVVVSNVDGEVMLVEAED